MLLVETIKVIQLLRQLTLLLAYLCVALIWSSCSLTPNFSDTPSIEFLGISRDTFSQGAILNDSILLSFSFRDGDGDLGTETVGILENIILTDSRTNERYDRYKIPPLDISGAMTGIEGDITLKVFNTCCLFPDNIPPCQSPPEYPFDELVLTVQMIDDSGKESNTITTPTITLLCD